MGMSIVVGMKFSGERPVWSMSGSEMLSALDQLDAELARRQTYRLSLIAGLDNIGHAEQLGAHDTARLLEFRYRLNPIDARRDLRLARALPNYNTVSDALAEHATDDPGDDASAGPGGDMGADATDTDTVDDTAPDSTDGTAGTTTWVLRPAQAEAIVSTLERHATRIPIEHRDVIEQQLVNLAGHLPPQELRKSAKHFCDLVDADGPEPDETKAYDRESLKMSTADHGVKFNGFLANENAELLRSLIHTGAKPRKTVTGDLDPRPRDKRQADALTAALTIAAAATETGFRPARPASTTPADHGEPASTAATTAAPGAANHSAATNPAAVDGGLSAATGAAGTPTAAADADAGHAAGDTDTDTADVDGDLSAATGADTRPADTGATNTGPADTAPAGGAPADTADAGGCAAPATGGGWVPGFGAKANITVTIDLNDLKAATANATGQLVYGDNLSAAAIRRLACDANIIPLVLGSNSEPLDVGRSERLITRPMRRALNARDKGCVVCGAPPIYCDAHHLTSWLDDGATAIWNLVLLCRRHHVDLHAGHWTITIIDGIVHVTRPTWADPSPPRARRPQQTSPPSRPRPGQFPQPAATTSDAEPGSPFDPEPSHGAPAGESSLGRAAGVDGLDESRASDVPRLDPWGEPVNTEQAPRFKWRAGPAAREEAARFAVWGDDPSSEASNQPNPSERNAAPNRAAPFDPWNDATLDTTANATLTPDELAPR
jgi:hypothetical protein